MPSIENCSPMISFHHHWQLPVKAFYITFEKLLIYHNSNTQSWECHTMYLRILFTPHTCCRRLCLVLGVLMGWSRLGVGRGESSGKVGKQFLTESHIVQMNRKDERQGKPVTEQIWVGVSHQSGHQTFHMGQVPSQQGSVNIDEKPRKCWHRKSTWRFEFCHTHKVPITVLVIVNVCPF